MDDAIEKGFEPGNSPRFQENTESLYNMAYTLKFMLKKRAETRVDLPVMALEGLWWVEDGFFDIRIKDNWFYTLMIMVPDLVTPQIFAEALAALKKKKGDQTGFARLRLETFEEGRCVQMMHIGPYATEPATVKRCASLRKKMAIRIGLRRAENTTRSIWAIHALLQKSSRPSCAIR